MIDRIAELESLLGKATVGKWRSHNGDILVGSDSILRGWDDETGWFDNADDAKLTVALKEAAPDLIAVVRAARAYRDDPMVPADDSALLDALAKLDGEVK